MDRARLDVIRLLGERKYKEADRRLSDFERQLTELSAKVPTGAPPELNAIREKVNFARKRIELSLPTSARKALDEISPLIESIKKLIPVKEK